MPQARTCCKRWQHGKFALAESLLSRPDYAAQALVEQCSAAGQPEQVERCVLHMDVASLDFSQARFRCERYHISCTL